MDGPYTVEVSPGTIGEVLDEIRETIPEKSNTAVTAIEGRVFMVFRDQRDHLTMTPAEAKRIISILLQAVYAAEHGDQPAGTA